MLDLRESDAGGLYHHLNTARLGYPTVMPASYSCPGGDRKRDILHRRNTVDRVADQDKGHAAASAG